MEKEHQYRISLDWTGNLGQGTKSYTAYSRDHIVRASGNADIALTSDPAFRGSPGRFNPEQLLVSALSSCHLLWYLHLCAINDIVVTEYRDEARGVMIEAADGGGYFKEVTLCPVVTITDAARIPMAMGLHREAAKKCFIANSCNFPVRHEPNCLAHEL
ncbi:MAG TPA: OsmC family protein [Puia sp.]|nr:OsmC family protein [Puia sp.]